MDRIMTSRKLWVGVSAVIGIILCGVFFDSETALRITKAVLVIAGAYLVGQGTVDFIQDYRGVVPDRLVASRKLWIAVASIIGVILTNCIGYNELQASWVTRGIVVVSLAYILSQSSVDFTATLKKVKIVNVLASRKLWVAVAIMIGIVICNGLFSEPTARQITLGSAGIGLLYLAAQGAVDVSKQILRARG